MAHFENIFSPVAVVADGADGGALGQLLPVPRACCGVAKWRFSARSATATIATMSRGIDVAVLTVIPPELRALQDALGVEPTQRERSEGGTVFQRASVPSELLARPLSVVLGCIGEAGNDSAAAAVAEAIARYTPRAVLLMGIAAGLRGKTRVGEVVLSDRVVAYESAALVRAADGTHVTQPRPEIDRTPYAMNQDVVFYRPDTRRIRARFEAIKGTFPAGADDAQRALFETHVVSEVSVRAATIASGEKLLKDPERFKALRDLHDKIEAGEMEAAGLVEACRRAGLPWLVVRGISDFGDELKDDRFHALASKMAAAVLVDFLAHGFSVGDVERGATAGHARRAASPFVYGRPMLTDAEFVGREYERSEVLRFIRDGAPVQILGLPLMGRSSLLRWVGRHAPTGRPVVELDPSKTGDPVSMVHAIARALGRADEAATVRDTVSVCALLRSMTPLLLLVDDADALARSGQGFEHGFFDQLRSLTQHGDLWWVSTSHEDLEKVYAARGLVSQFLNDSRRVKVGALREEEVRSLASRVPSTFSDALLAQAGGWARGIQWLGDRRGARTEAEDETLDAFVSESASVFRRWWGGLDSEQRQTMKALLPRPEVSSLSNKTRVCARSLRDWGLAEERERRLGVAGRAWEDFVRDV